MNQSEFRAYHEREAARLGSLAANATTAALKARLLEEAEKHDRLAKGLDDLEGAGRLAAPLLLTTLRTCYYITGAGLH
jgi:hypothetical protein